MSNASLDCVPCLCGETVAAVRRLTPDPALQAAIVGEALFHLAMRDPAASPTALAHDLRELIRQRTGCEVPSFPTHQPACALGSMPHFAASQHSPSALL